MKLEKRSPLELVPNPWNSNHLTPEAELKLVNSLQRHKGLFKPILIRTLPNGTFQIIGGEHRWRAAQSLGLTEVPVINLGEMPDDQAKEISILDNGRYGQDDATQLAELLAELGSPSDLSLFMPFDVGDIETITAAARIDLDQLDLDSDDSPEIDTTPPPRIPKTHMTFRVKVPLEDHDTVQNVINQIIKDHGLDDSDSAVNAGDALVTMIRHWTKTVGSP